MTDMDQHHDSPIMKSLSATIILVVSVGDLTLAPIQNPCVPRTNKSNHLLAFLALAFPLSFSRPRIAPWVALAAAAYGGAIEVIQPLVGRDKELLDLLGDTACGILGGAAGSELRMLRVWWT